MKKIISYLFVLILIFNCSEFYSQQKGQNLLKQNLQEKQKAIKQVPSAAEKIEIISKLFAEREIDQLSGYFAKQVYVSLKTGERGFYSNNQTYYVIQNFMKIYEPLNFQVTSKLTDATSTHFTGKLICHRKGIIESFQVYFELSWNGTSWEISQITIN